jgi:hypothetical protein
MCGCVQQLDGIKEMQRPSFLQNRKYTETVAELISAFRETSLDERKAVDSWFIWACVSGSMTWQESHLDEWLRNIDDLETLDVE